MSIISSYTPRVFISYSHDSQNHKTWVLGLATSLREYGIDSILDTWDLNAGADLAHFMESNLRSADFVLAICTPRYVAKANSGEGGVGYEKMIVTADLLKDVNSEKIIPIVRIRGEIHVPTFLESKAYIDLSNSETLQAGFDQLVATLHKVKLIEKPAVRPLSSSLNEHSRIDKSKSGSTVFNMPVNEKPVVKYPNNDGLVNDIQDREYTIQETEKHSSGTNKSTGILDERFDPVLTFNDADLDNSIVDTNMDYLDEFLDPDSTFDDTDLDASIVDSGTGYLEGGPDSDLTFGENDIDYSEDRSVLGIEDDLADSNTSRTNTHRVIATKCTNCLTVFEVSRELLSSNDTRVRCGECLSIFDAAENTLSLK